MQREGMCTRAFTKLLTSENRQTALSATKVWNTLGLSIGTLRLDEAKLRKIEEDDH
jgi:hypothetical protein